MYVEECWEHVEAAILCKMFSVCYTCMFGTRKSQSCCLSRGEGTSLRNIFFKITYGIKVIFYGMTEQK